VSSYSIGKLGCSNVNRVSSVISFPKVVVGAVLYISSGDRHLNPGDSHDLRSHSPFPNSDRSRHIKTCFDSQSQISISSFGVWQPIVAGTNGFPFPRSARDLLFSPYFRSRPLVVVLDFLFYFILFLLSTLFSLSIHHFLSLHLNK
jgi:hypothetical protein